MRDERLPALQTLRACAAIMVLIGHVIAEAEHYFARPLPGDLVPWTRGVDLFFVISGFVITLSAGRYLRCPGAFLWRRMVRVVPLYWLFTTLMVALLLVVPTGAKDTAFDLPQILASYLFFPFERWDGRVAPVLSLGWTLNYEMFFYLITAACLTLARPLGAVVMVVLVLVLTGMVVAFDAAPLRFWTNPILVEFLLGVALARAWQMGWRLPHLGLAGLALGLGVILLIALDQTSLPRCIAAGVPAAVIVASGTLLCPTGRPPLMIWGDASYAIYLSHRFTLRAATLGLLPLLPATIGGAVIYVIIVCAMALAVGLATHLWLEKPMLRACRLPRSAAPA